MGLMGDPIAASSICSKYFPLEHEICNIEAKLKKENDVVQTWGSYAVFLDLLPVAS